MSVCLHAYLNANLAACLCLHVYLSACMPLHMFVYHSICLSYTLPVCIFVRIFFLSFRPPLWISFLSTLVSICMSACWVFGGSVCILLFLFVCVFFCRFLSLSCQSVLLSFYVSVCLSLCTTIYLSLNLSVCWVCWALVLSVCLFCLYMCVFFSRHMSLSLRFFVVMSLMSLCLCLLCPYVPLSCV